METEVTYRISKSTEGLMRALALIIYGANFLINLVGDWFGVGEVVSLIFMIVAYVIYVFWFKSHKVSVFESKVMWQFILSAIISAIPILNVLFFRMSKSGIPLPGIASMVEKVTEQSRAEDRKNAAKKIDSGSGKRSSSSSSSSSNDSGEDSSPSSSRYERPSYREGPRSTLR